MKTEGAKTEGVKTEGVKTEGVKTEGVIFYSNSHRHRGILSLICPDSVAYCYYYYTNCYNIKGSQ